jgi:hypothetical protein
MVDDTSSTAAVVTATAAPAGAVGKPGADDGNAEEAATKLASVPPRDALSGLCRSRSKAVLRVEPAASQS